MKLIAFFLTAFLFATATRAGTPILGDWIVTKYLSDDISALTPSIAEETYGKEVRISENRVQFGDDVLIDPVIVEVTTSNLDETTGWGELGSLAGLIRSFEIRDRNGNRWMAPLGSIVLFESVVDQNSMMFFYWDGIGFFAYRQTEAHNK